MRASISGVGHQENSYLAGFMLDKRYRVFDTSRDTMASKVGRIAQ